MKYVPAPDFEAKPVTDLPFATVIEGSRVEQSTLQDTGNRLLTLCRSTALMLLICSLLRFASLEGILGALTALIFLCCSARSQSLRSAASHARFLRTSALIIGWLAVFGACIHLGFGAVLIPRMGAMAEETCLEKVPSTNRVDFGAKQDQAFDTLRGAIDEGAATQLRIILPRPCDVYRQVMLDRVWATRSAHRMLSVETAGVDSSVAFSDWLTQNIRSLSPEEPSHQRCQSFAESVKIVGALGLVLSLALELALLLAAVHARLNAQRLVEFVNAAGPNIL